MWQLWAYTQLTGKKQAWIAYTCPSYPEEVIEYEKSWVFNADEENQVWLNMNYDRIPKEKRVKMFKVPVDHIDISLVNQIFDVVIQKLFEINQNYTNQQPLPINPN